MIRYDFLIASFLALIGLGAAALSYESIKAHRQAGLVIAEKIPYAPTIYAVKFNNSCIGRVSTGIIKVGDSSHVGEFISRLYLKFRDEQFELYLQGQGEFNPLGQLSEGTLSIQFSGQEYQILSSGVNPLSLTVSSPGVTKIQNTAYSSLPGPLLISDLGPNQGYRLEYPPISSFSNLQRTLPWLEQSFQVSLLEPLLSQLELVAEPDDNSSAGPNKTVKCAGLEQSWFDLNQLLNLAMGLPAAINSINRALSSDHNRGVKQP